MKKDVTNDVCWKCKEEIEEYCIIPTIYYLDGSEETVEDDTATGMTEEEMENYTKKIKEEHDNVDDVEFGEFCPHYLACM